MLAVRDAHRKRPACRDRDEFSRKVNLSSFLIHWSLYMRDFFFKLQQALTVSLLTAEALAPMAPALRLWVEPDLLSRQRRVAAAPPHGAARDESSPRLSMLRAARDESSPRLSTLPRHEA